MPPSKEIAAARKAAKLRRWRASLLRGRAQPLRRATTMRKDKDFDTEANVVDSPVGKSSMPLHKPNMMALPPPGFRFPGLSWTMSQRRLCGI
jgi:hypothetical protein